MCVSMFGLSRNNSNHTELKHNIRFLLFQANCYSKQLHKLHVLQYWLNLFPFLFFFLEPEIFLLLCPLTLTLPPQDIETANPYKRRQVSSNSTIHSLTQRYVCTNNKASRRKNKQTNGQKKMVDIYVEMSYNKAWCVLRRACKSRFHTFLMFYESLLMWNWTRINNDSR